MTELHVIKSNDHIQRAPSAFEVLKEGSIEARVALLFELVKQIAVNAGLWALSAFALNTVVGTAFVISNAAMMGATFTVFGSLFAHSTNPLVNQNPVLDNATLCFLPSIVLLSLKVLQVAGVAITTPAWLPIAALVTACVGATLVGVGLFYNPNSKEKIAKAINSGHPQQSWFWMDNHKVVIYNNPTRHRHVEGQASITQKVIVVSNQALSRQAYNLIVDAAGGNPDDVIELVKTEPIYMNKEQQVNKEATA